MFYDKLPVSKFIVMILMAKGMGQYYINCPSPENLANFTDRYKKIKN